MAVVCLEAEAIEVGKKYEGRDQNGMWFPITITRKNDDGTYACEVHDHVRTKWLKIDLQNMRRMTMSWVQLEDIEVGQKYEGRNHSGSWFPITITGANEDGSFACDVHDHLRTQWPALHPHNMRRITMAWVNLEDIEVGQRYEARSHDGKWYLVTIIGRNDDNTFACDVHDHVKTKWPTVYLQNIRELSMPWADPESIEVGLKYEGRNVKGDWWPITITGKCEGGGFTCDVHDNLNTKWSSVYAHNMRTTEKTVVQIAMSSIDEKELVVVGSNLAGIELSRVTLCSSAQSSELACMFSVALSVHPNLLSFILPNGEELCDGGLFHALGLCKAGS